MTDLQVRPIPAEETLDLRNAILRPGLPRETAIFPGDGAATSRHYGAFLDGRIVGVATMHYVPLLDRPDFESAYQLRGMATLEEMRGHGVGGELLQAAMKEAKELGASWMWCNARTPAAGFYQRHGFKVQGGIFDIPLAGPHYRMLRAL